MKYSTEIRPGVMTELKKMYYYGRPEASFFDFCMGHLELNPFFIFPKREPTEEEKSIRAKWIQDNWVELNGRGDL